MYQVTQQMSEEDSFQGYKRYLQETTGDYGCKLPNRPMNPFMRFFLERTCEETKKDSSVNFKELTKKVSLEWKNLPAQKAQYYRKVSNIRLKEWTEIKEQYMKITRKKQPLPAYSLFVMRKYEQYKKEFKNKTTKELLQQIKEEWRGLDDKEKGKYKNQAQNQKLLAEIKPKEEEIAQYKVIVEEFNRAIFQEKEKILKKYSCDKESKKKRMREKKTLEKIEKYRQRNEERRNQKEKRRQQREKQIRLRREAAMEKIKIEKELYRVQREKQREQLRVEKEKQAEVQRKAKEEAKKKERQEKNKIKEKQTKSVEKSKIKDRKETSRSKSAKKSKVVAPVKKVIAKAIKEEVVKPTKKTVSEKVKAEVKLKPKKKVNKTKQIKKKPKVKKQVKAKVVASKTTAVKVVVKKEESVKKAKRRR